MEDKTLLVDRQQLMQTHHYNVFSSAGVKLKESTQGKERQCLFWQEKEGKTPKKYLVNMQFDYANADRKWGDWQQPTWLSLWANRVRQIWWSSMMRLQRQWMRKGWAMASTWTCANHLMLSCTTSLSLPVDMDLTNAVLVEGIGSKELWSTVQCPRGDQSQVLSLRGQYWDQHCLISLSVTVGLRGTLSKSASDTKPCGAVTMLEGKNA